MKCQPIRPIQTRIAFLHKVDTPKEPKITVIPEPQKDVFKKSEDNTDKKVFRDGRINR